MCNLNCNENFNGQFIQEFIVSDGSDLKDTVEVHLNIRQVNDPSGAVTLENDMPDYSISNYLEGEDGINLDIYSDSELIVNQIKGNYKIKNDRMIALHGQVMDALNGVKTWSIHHIRREKNKRADGLSKQGMALAKAAK